MILLIDSSRDKGSLGYYMMISLGFLDILSLVSWMHCMALV